MRAAWWQRTRRRAREAALRAGRRLLPSVLLTTLTGCFGAPGYSGPTTGHFDGNGFIARYGAPPKGFWAFVGWQKSSVRPPWPEWIEADPAPPPPPVANGRLRVTWVNHATVLIQVDGVNILTDPIFSERASPVDWAGPRRVRAPGVRFDDLPAIDVVLVSHNHYDHLDLPTLVRLAERDHPVVLLGLGNQQLLEASAIAGGVDLDWWDSVELGHGVRAHFVPAAHFSGRGIADRNQTLWGGFVLETSFGPVYFAGDTGMGEHFSEIRQRFGPIALALLPIGAYAPRWFMHPVHISPEEAVQAHQILEAGTSVAMHFGTFPLADDAIDDPPRALMQALVAAGEDPARFWLLDFGEGREL